MLGDRPVAVCRELTKLHEEIRRGPLTDVVASLPEPRGEFTIVVAPAEQVEAPAGLPGPEELLFDFGQLTEELHLDRRAAITRLAQRYGVRSREVYAAVERARG